MARMAAPVFNRLTFAVAWLSVAVPAVAQESVRQYLSGRGTDDAVAWDFSVSAGDNSGRWSAVPVPSCWDVQGFGKLSYQAKGLGEQGKYRHRFTAPADWAGRTVWLVFDGSMTDTRAWVNGTSAGPAHRGAFYRFKYDVTRLVHLGEENLLEVTVDKESADPSVNNAERRGDYWNFGGIFRPVYLEATPAQHVDRVAVNAAADGAFAVDVFAAGVTSADRVRAQIVDGDGKPVGAAFSATLSGSTARLATKVDAPRQWTAETPNLYAVDVTLLAGDTVLHHVRQRFGFRTVEVRAGDGLYVNGRRVLLKGTDRHSFWPDTGRATCEAVSRGDVTLMKAMNNNAVRMSHYPPDEHFLEACDEAGLYVLDELAGWHQAYDEPTGRALVEAMVTRDVNHPSILFWDNGNEGGWNAAVDDEFARWDPQHRGVLHPWAKFRGVENKHYPTYDAMVKLARGPDVFFPTEFQHALFDGGGGAALEDYWDVVRSGRAAAGGFIWAFVDEAVRRTDDGGRMDTMGNKAPDGILGPYRQKEGSFYTVKRVWSPVVVTGTPPGPLTVENRCDFTNADRCTFSWETRDFSTPGDGPAGHRVVDAGRLVAPAIAPHERGTLRLDVPPRPADAIALRVDDPQGRELWTWVWPLRDPAADRPAAADAVRVTDDADAIRVTAGDQSVTFGKSTGRLTAVTRGGHAFPLVNGPRLAVGNAALRTIDHRMDGGDCVVTATYAGDLNTVVWRVAPGGDVRLDYRYTLTGSRDFHGVSFDLPEAKVQGMRWLGQGPSRVWKNRLPGGTLDVWDTPFNRTVTGYREWAYPEFKGYYAGVRWMELRTTDGPIRVTVDDPAVYVQVLRADFAGDPQSTPPATGPAKGKSLSANAWAPFPDAGFSVLHGIPAIGNKFNAAGQLGPKSQPNVAAGEYRGTVRFRFGDGR